MDVALSLVLCGMSLVNQKCLLHVDREAVGRCPVCRHFFCRECLVEHEGLFVCNRCLVKITAAQGVPQHRFNGFLALAQSLVGLIVAWLVFDWIGRLLLLVPPDLHRLHLP
jgi:hypothetical protein